MQSHMIGMQSSLDRILAVVQGQAGGSMGPPPIFTPPRMSPPPNGERHRFPPLPGFAPPVSYSLIAHSSDLTS